MERYTSVVILFSFVYSIANGVRVENGTVKITVGTTAGYTDAGNFVRNHLAPTFHQFSDAVGIDVEFVPWGRTVRQADGSLVCEFGAQDCWANRLQRCVLNHLRGNVRSQIDYMACEFTDPYPAYKLGNYRCATGAGMRIIEADHCVNNPMQDNLDELAEAAASQPMADINTVPYVVFNDDVSAHYSAQGLRRINSIVCFALADENDSDVVSCQI